MSHLTRETTRLEHLVENVLAASRLDRGMRPSMPLVPLDLGAEVREAVTAFAPLAASRRATLDTESPRASRCSPTRPRCGNSCSTCSTTR